MLVFLVEMLFFFVSFDNYKIETSSSVQCFIFDFKDQSPCNLEDL